MPATHHLNSKALSTRRLSILSAAQRHRELAQVAKDQGIYSVAAAETMLACSCERQARMMTTAIKAVSTKGVFFDGLA